jgi:hypothetical protein
MQFINIHDGTVCTLEPPVLPVLPQTFEMIFAQYSQHLEVKSLGPNGERCKSDTRGLLKRYPVTASGFRYIGKETERGWEDAEDVSTLMPELLKYAEDRRLANEQLRERLQQIPLRTLQRDTGLSRHSIIRARRGERVHPRTIQLLAKLPRGGEGE